MQSRRTWLPELRGPVDFASAIHLPDAVVADPGGDAIGAQRCVLVGPEGGFTDAELESGRATVSVGTGILRVETAAIAVAAWWALHGADAT